jgi:hypothetical protein
MIVLARNEVSICDTKPIFQRITLNRFDRSTREKENAPVLEQPKLKQFTSEKH